MPLREDNIALTRLCHNHRWALDEQVEWNEAENFIYADRNPCLGPQAVLDGVLMRLGAEWDGFSAATEQKCLTTGSFHRNSFNLSSVAVSG